MNNRRFRSEFILTPEFCSINAFNITAPEFPVYVQIDNIML
ncbi:MAG: hypothetical protein V7K27_32920 [Nostoc sp.]